MYTWLPCTAMQDLKTNSLPQIHGAQGAYITWDDGSQSIDAISSWWCKPLGHQHPRLREALLNQARTFEHVLSSNAHNPYLEELSETLCQRTQTLRHAFYSSDGSSAVEIALKISVHAQALRGERQRTHFFTLPGSYHGESIGALSLSDLALYKKPYLSLTFPTTVLPPLPSYEEDCMPYWESIQGLLKAYADESAAVIVEPLLQGAAGMRLYPPKLLQLLRNWTQQQGIHLIADEIMTGMGCTGLPLACQHAGIEPDLLCLGKGLTGGWLPMSVTLVTEELYHSFYELPREENFLHSHTYSGNALAARVALECLRVIEEEDLYAQARALQPLLSESMNTLAEKTGLLTNVRGIGTVIAAESPYARTIADNALNAGVLLRPLGNTLYYFLPLNSTKALVEELHEKMEEGLCSLQYCCQA